MNPTNRPTDHTDPTNLAHPAANTKSSQLTSPQYSANPTERPNLPTLLRLHRAGIWRFALRLHHILHLPEPSQFQVSPFRFPHLSDVQRTFFLTQMYLCF
jgi:hypothetical protein